MVEILKDKKVTTIVNSKKI